MHRFAASHPLLTAALAGAAAGLTAAVLLLCTGPSPRAGHVFAAASLPAAWWHGMLFGWVWKGSVASEFLTILALNGAAWGVGLTPLGRGMLRSARVRWIALGSADAGTALAVAVWMLGMPVGGAWDGVRGLVLLAQCPGMMLLAMNGYDTLWWDGAMTGGLFRPGPVTLLWFAVANTLLFAMLARVADFTWRWMRMPLPARGPVAEG